MLVGADEASRKKARDAWSAWWKDNAGKVDLAKLRAGPRFLGYTLALTVIMLAIGGVSFVTGMVFAPDFCKICSGP